MARLNRAITLLPLVALLLYQVYVTQLQRQLRVLGVFRTPKNTPVAPEDLVVIEGTTHCEDLHYYAPSNELFTACESVFGSRAGWFPPITNFNLTTGRPPRGKIVVINAKTQKSRSLVLEGFDGIFVTHGIDVIPDPKVSRGKAVYIFAVNHPPNPEHYTANGVNEAVPKARSVIEVFHHVIGSHKAKHVRTIRHPLVRTPNDILAVSPTAFFVTNDHFHREGRKRMLEDFYWGADWTNTVFVQYDMVTPGGSDSEGVIASVAINGLHNNNGLGRGRTPNEVAVVQASNGVLNIGRIQEDHTIAIQERILMDSAIDNPSYFSDPYADSQLDASGFVNCGHARGIDFPEEKDKLHAFESIMAWKTSPTAKSGPGWENELLFEDDGRRIRTCSTAVMVAIDPREEGGKRRAWLYLTGYWASNMIAVKKDL